MQRKLTLSIVMAAFFASSNAYALPVFPGAEGFGTDTVAGSGRHLNPPQTKVYKITSLANSGAGTLRECMEATGPRTCVFEVSGYIDLTDRLRVRSPYLTVAGQTAPDPGIHVRGATITIEASHVLVQHIGARPGDGATGQDPGTRDAINIWKGSTTTANIVIDHVSMTWGLDENFSTYRGPISNVTVSNSLVAEGLCDSIHPENDPCHSMGMMIDTGGRRFSIHDNLFAHNNDRNIRMKDDIELEFGNNVVYNWGGSSGWNQFNMSTSSSAVGNRVNFFGNYYKAGASSPKYPAIYYTSTIPKTSKVWVSDNIHSVKRPTNSGDEWLVSGLPTTMRASSPTFSRSNVPISMPEDTALYVPMNVGARPWDRFSADTRIITEMLSGAGSMKDCVGGCSRSAGGWPSVPKNTRRLELPSDPTGDDNNDGYTNLENYLFEFLNDGQPSANQPTPTPVPTEVPETPATPTPFPTPNPQHYVPDGYIGCTITAGGNDTDKTERPFIITLTGASKELSRGDFSVVNGVRNNLTPQGSLPTTTFVLSVSPSTTGKESTVKVTLPAGKTYSVDGEDNIECSTTAVFGATAQATPTPTATPTTAPTKTPTPRPTSTPTPKPTVAMCWMPCGQ